jgi:hypothetical protein
MACNRTNPIVTFERDLPDFSFLVTSGGQPLRFNNLNPALYVVDQSGANVAQFGLEALSTGKLNLTLAEGQSLEEFYTEIEKLTKISGYRTQIFMKAVTPPTEDIGLDDIIDPYWLNYIPPEAHTPGWFSGETRQDQTVPTEIPWNVREAFKLRGT